MDLWKALAALIALACPGVIFVGSAQEQLTIDATKQPSPPLRGRGPFAGTGNPGHSPGLPIQLELEIPTGELRLDGTTPADFMITNVGTEPIALHVSVDQNQNLEGTEILTLWFTSDAIKDAYFRDQQTRRLVKTEAVGTSAELYGRANDPKAFHLLLPNETIRVHASSRVWPESWASLVHKSRRACACCAGARRARGDL
jgi:hypothetical protein